MVLAFLYWILEIKQWRGAWMMPILVLGMNAIAGFVADSFVYGPGYGFTAKAANGTVVACTTLPKPDCWLWVRAPLMLR